MTIRLFYTSLTLLLLSTLLLTNPFAQDYTQLSLPAGAKARLGKGVITDIYLSPDGTRLAIASSIGVWLYDSSTRVQTAPLIRYDQQTTSQMAFSPDSKTLAMSAYDKTIRLWNTDTGDNLLMFKTPNGPFISLKFSDGDKTLISQNRNGTVWFWDITTGKQLNTLRPKLPKFRLGKDRIWSFATDAFIDHTGSVTFAVGNRDGTISIQDGGTGHQIRKLIVQTDDSSSLSIQSSKPYAYKREIVDGKLARKWVNGLYFSPDGKTLVSTIDYRTARWDGRGWSGRGGPTELWDVDTGEQLGVFSYGIGATFSGDGKTVAIKGNGECAIWDIATRRKIAEFPRTPNIRFSGDGKTLAIIEKNGYKIWNIATRSEIASHNPVVEWFEVSPERFMLSQDGTLLVTADEYGTVAVRETRNAKQLRLVTTNYTKPFTALVFSHDGKTLASGDKTGNIQIWDTNTRTKQLPIKTAAYPIKGLAFTTDNVTLTAATSQGEIIQWDITTNKQAAAHILPNTNIVPGFTIFDDGTGLEIEGLFIPNSEKLLIKNQTVDIWNIATDKPPHLLTEVVVGGWRRPIALTPDGSILASGSDAPDATDLWSTHTGKRIATFKSSKNWINDLLIWLRLRHSSIYALAFTHDGKILAVGTRDKHIQLWNVSTHQHIGSLEGHKHVVCELTFSPDGKTLASGDSGGQIHLWELPTQRHLTIFNGHKSYVRTLAFAPDGKTLSSIDGGEGTILLWNVTMK